MNSFVLSILFASTRAELGYMCSPEAEVADQWNSMLLDTPTDAEDCKAKGEAEINGNDTDDYCINFTDDGVDLICSLYVGQLRSDDVRKEAEEDGNTYEAWAMSAGEWRPDLAVEEEPAEEEEEEDEEAGSIKMAVSAFAAATLTLATFTV